MNIERLKQVREFIACLPPKACDMTDWLILALNDDATGHVTFSVMQERGFQCGSAGCIAGWTEIMVNHATRPEISDWKRAGTWLELEPEEHEMLFMGFPDRTPDEGWKAWMVQRLDDVIEAGYVFPWDVAAEDYDPNRAEEEPEEEYDEPEEEVMIEDE